MIKGEMKELNQTVSSPIAYELKLSSQSIPLNDWIGSVVRIEFTGVKRCIACHRSSNKLFQGGYCFPCFRSLAECDLCIVKPHECHFHLGTCRDEEFAKTHCMIPHYVYLAWSSGFKVGLTRKGRQLKRWMDQGATYAVVIAETPTRKLAGELEMDIARHLPDKTDWRKMLKEEAQPEISLQALRDTVIRQVSEAYSPYLLQEIDEPLSFVYPRAHDFAVNLKSANLDKAPEFTGTLRGIKGQYLLFDEGVFNVKKHAGYEVTVSFS